MTKEVTMRDDIKKLPAALETISASLKFSLEFDEQVRKGVVSDDMHCTQPERMDRGTVKAWVDALEKSATALESLLSGQPVEVGGVQKVLVDADLPRKLFCMGSDYLVLQFSRDGILENDFMATYHEIPAVFQHFAGIADVDALMREFHEKVEVDHEFCWQEKLIRIERLLPFKEFCALLTASASALQADQGNTEQKGV